MKTLTPDERAKLARAPLPTVRITPGKSWAGRLISEPLPGVGPGHGGYEDSSADRYLRLLEDL